MVAPGLQFQSQLGTECQAAEAHGLYKWISVSFLLPSRAVNAADTHYFGSIDTNLELIKAVLPVLQGSAEGVKALAEEEPGPASGNFILPSASGFAKIVNGFSNSEILVESVPPMRIQDKQMPCLLGLFDDGHSEVIRAICVLELRAACILGAAVSDVSSEEVHEAISRQTIDKPMLEGCKKVLGVVSAAVYDSATQSDLQLGSVNVIPKIFPKLEEIYSQNSGERSDFEIAVVGYGQGLMTIISA